MITPERRLVVELPSYGEVMEEVKVGVLRLVGEKVIEFQEEQLLSGLVSFGKGTGGMARALSYALSARKAQSSNAEQGGKGGFTLGVVK